MSGELDHDRPEWTADGKDGPVLTSSGRPRPVIIPVDEVVVHYGGAGKHWIDPDDTPADFVHPTNPCKICGQDPRQHLHEECTLINKKRATTTGRRERREHGIDLPVKTT